MTRATKAKGLPVNRKPFAESFSPFSYGLAFSPHAPPQGHRVRPRRSGHPLLGVDPGSSRNKEREMGEPATQNWGQFYLI